jgi:hypothetical protein
MLPLQEIRMISETALYLSLIGIVVAIVRAVGWGRDMLSGPYVRRGQRRGRA